jgi:hypothetical protein
MCFLPRARPVITHDVFLAMLKRAGPAQAARQLGVDRVTVSRWLSGKRRPAPALLLLAELLWGQDAEWPHQPGDLGTCPQCGK